MSRIIFFSSSTGSNLRLWRKVCLCSDVGEMCMIVNIMHHRCLLSLLRNFKLWLQTLKDLTSLIKIVWRITSISSAAAWFLALLLRILSSFKFAKECGLRLGSDHRNTCISSKADKDAGFEPAARTPEPHKVCDHWRVVFRYRPPQEVVISFSI